MENGYWNQEPLTQHHHQTPGLLKRTRNDFDFEAPNYLAQNDDCGETRTIEDIISRGSVYDRYRKSTKVSSLSSGSSMPSPPVREPFPTPHERELGFHGRFEMDTSLGPRSHQIMPLPHDASDILFIKGLPSDCTRREIAHIFRPFVGYKDVRLMKKESKNRGGDPLILCFVDFVDAACAATAMSVLQGYKLDDYDLDSVHLRIQFSTYPAPLYGSHGKQ